MSYNENKKMILKASQKPGKINWI